MLPIPIYKGDSTDAFGVRVIKINLKTELVLTNATATFTLLSFKKNFTSAEIATKVLTITIPAEITRGFPIGNVYGKLCLYDSSLRVLTAACHIPFRVELAGSGIYGGWCAERTPLAEITVEAGVDYALAYNKPTINNIVVDGEKTASDYGLALLSQIPTLLSQLQSDATHRTVTDAEKAQWNAGSSIPDIEIIRANAQLGANHSRLKDNPHQVSKSQVGLGNVDNTSDANKPVSTAQQNALNGKVDKVDGKGLSEKDFTASDKTKLDGIETGAQKNVNANWTSASGSAGFIQNKPKCNIEDLPETFTDNEMRTKLNSLLGWMRTNFAVLTVCILIATSTFAEPEVLTALKGGIPNTANVVTNVTGLSELASKQSVTDSVGYTTAVSNKLEEAIAIATPGDYYNVSNKAYTALQQSDIVNSTTSTDASKVLSANMGKSLQDQIQNLKQRGRYLSIWNATNGLAQTVPTVDPYMYKSGDYFIVGVVSDSTTVSNYRPYGVSYSTNSPSRVVELDNLIVNDTYYYDGSAWTLLHTEQKEVAFSTLAGSPYDNTELASALNVCITNVFTNGVSIVTDKVADIYGPVREIASSATVTNAGAVAVAESIGSAAYDEAVAAAKTYTDNSTNGLIRASYNVSPQATDLFGWKFVPPTDSQSSPYPATIFVKYGSVFSEAIRFGGPGTTCSLVGTWNIQNGWDYLTTEYGMQTLPSYLSSLAWHPTSATLSGYGITDAYTKEEVNAISNGAVASAVSKIRKDVITDGTNTVNASLKFIKTAQPVAGVGTWKSTDSERGVETVNWVEILDGWVPASHSIGIFRAGTRWNVAGVGISIYYNTLPPVIELDFVRDGVHVHEKLEYQVFTETMLATTNAIPSRTTIETYAINAVSNSDNLWNASNAKLTTRITQVSTPIAEGVFETNADYALTNLTGSAITLSSGCIGNVTMAANTSVILDFSAAENRSGDCLLYAINATATDYTISPQPTAQYAFVSADLAKALTIGKATTNILSFTRLKADTVLVSKLEVK